MIGVSETMNLGVKFESVHFVPFGVDCVLRLGIDPKLLAGILNTSSGRCWASDTYNPCPGVMESKWNGLNLDLKSYFLRRCARKPRLHWRIRQCANAQGDFVFSHATFFLIAFESCQDLGLAINAAANSKSPVPLGSLANQIYQIMCAQVRQSNSSVFVCTLNGTFPL